MMNRKGDILIDRFELRYIKGETVQFSNSFVVETSEDGKQITEMSIDVKGLCYFLCAAAEDFYNSCEQKDLFIEHTFILNAYDT